MPIITTYPFKKAPLDKKDEIVITEVNASGQPSRSTSMEVMADFTLRTNTFVFHLIFLYANFYFQNCGVFS